MKSIVTTELFRAIAERHGVACLDVLTGFKYIGEQIALWEEEGRRTREAPHFLFGGEESYGALYGTHARDKDAVIFGMVICELALQLKSQGKTLVDALESLYRTYGIYRERLLSLTFEGKSGSDKIHALMDQLRKQPFRQLEGVPLLCIKDYAAKESLDLKTSKKEPLTLPHSDVLQFELADRTKLVVRPSGTEPKIKIYCACREESKEPLAEAINACEDRADHYVAALKRLFS